MRPRLAVLLPFIAAGCQAPPARHEPRPRPEVTFIAIPASLEEAAAVYRRDKTFSALERVAAHLQPGMARADVERLMGEPDGWDDPSIYYRGDRVNDAGESLGVTLDFYRWYTDGRPSEPSDRLEQWAFGPGNRWEEGDPKLPRREAPPAPAPPVDVKGAARGARDYETLCRALPHLRLGTPRRDVERLLGPPDDCGPEGLPCHYRSTRKNGAGVPLGLSVEYRIHNKERTGLVVTERLEGVFFGPLPARP